RDEEKSAAVATMLRIQFSRRGGLPPQQPGNPAQRVCDAHPESDDGGADVAEGGSSRPPSGGAGTAPNALAGERSRLARGRGSTAPACLRGSARHDQRLVGGGALSLLRRALRGPHRRAA